MDGKSIPLSIRLPSVSRNVFWRKIELLHPILHTKSVPPPWNPLLPSSLSLSMSLCRSHSLNPSLSLSLSLSLTHTHQSFSFPPALTPLPPPLSIENRICLPVCLSVCLTHLHLHLPFFSSSPSPLTTHVVAVLSMPPKLQAGCSCNVVWFLASWPAWASNNPPYILFRLFLLFELFIVRVWPLAWRKWGTYCRFLRKHLKLSLFAVYKVSLIVSK